ncbi:MAG: hypothetical protein ACON34_01960 [Flavobacteriales bacterium]
MTRIACFAILVVALCALSNGCTPKEKCAAYNGTSLSEGLPQK